ARWVHRSTKARANSKQSSPAEKIILLGRATVRTGLRRSEPLLFLKEMNILSAHRSSNPICPATESVSAGFSPLRKYGTDMPSPESGRHSQPRGLRVWEKRRYSRGLGW